MKLYDVAGIKRFTFKKNIFIFISKDPETGIILAKRQGKEFRFQEENNGKLTLLR